MLTHLTISHYALIDSLDIDFADGFTVITGETGAGKSIMLGALGLLLGGRADAKAIQTGEKKCMVEASFSLTDKRLEPFFTANDIDYDEAECIVRREVLATGKSRAFINDVPVSATKLKELGQSLIDIHSQHQNLLIGHEHFLLDTLDTTAARPDLLDEYHAAYNLWREAEHQLHKLLESEKRGREDEEYYRFQLAQIDEAQLTPDEQNELEEEQRLLAHAEEVKQALYGAKEQIGNDTFSTSQNLRHAQEMLHTIESHLAEAAELAERLHSVQVELDDIEAELEQKAEQIEYDPARLNFVEERLNTIYGLQQKHHVDSVEAVLAIADNLRSRLSAIDNLDEDIAHWRGEAEKRQKALYAVAEKLTQVRQAAGKQIVNELTTSLQGLGMPHVQLEIKLTPRAVPDESGADNADFLFSANKNVPLQSVEQTASGGETARLMLSLKALIARRRALPTIVFDEIDTGVSGTMAERMALVMKEISSGSQVICITHLPQIAALGIHHFKVYKEEHDNRTLSHIIPLDEDGRVNEIANMLSGEKLTEAALDNARALLQH